MKEKMKLKNDATKTFTKETPGSSNNWPKPNVSAREKAAFWLRKLSKTSAT